MLNVVTIISFLQTIYIDKTMVIANFFKSSKPSTLYHYFKHIIILKTQSSITQKLLT